MTDQTKPGGSGRQAPRISVVIPAYNEPAENLRLLHDSLVAQSVGEFEAIIVDDCSSAPDYGCITDSRFRVVYKETNSGPAASRNRGAREAGAPVLFFTDGDCRLHEETLQNALASVAVDPASMGDTKVDATCYMGRAIGLLGFPGGGLIGFHNVWSVDGNGHTNSISSCNLAMRKDAFESLGGFDESFPVAAGEDTMLARTANEGGYRIRYTPSQIVYHEERAGLSGFLRWQLTRGRGVFHVRRRVRNIGGYTKQRMRGFSRSLTFAGWKYGPVVAVLFAVSLVCQFAGYVSEWRKGV